MKKTFKINKRRLFYSIYIVIAAMFSILLIFLISPFLLLNSIIFRLTLSILVRVNCARKALTLINKEKDLCLRIKWLGEIADYYRKKENYALYDDCIKKINGIKFELNYGNEAL